MMTALARQNLSRVEQAGLLARAGLAVAAMRMGGRPPEPFLEGEEALQARIVKAVRRRLKIAPNDMSEEALRAIEDALDAEMEAVGEPVDIEAALARIHEGPVIGSWTALLDYLQVALTHEPIEQFRVLFLDRKNVLIRDEVQHRGTVDHTPLYPREITRRALELHASAIIMVHNRSSDDPMPSRADIDMTKRVVEALAAVGITVHDHVILGKNRHTSFKSQRLI
jgi:DNA repair protein RadC